MWAETGLEGRVRRSIIRWAPVFIFGCVNPRGEGVGGVVFRGLVGYVYVHSPIVDLDIKGFCLSLCLGRTAAVGCVKRRATPGHCAWNVAIKALCSGDCGAGIAPDVYIDTSHNPTGSCRLSNSPSRALGQRPWRTTGRLPRDGQQSTDGPRYAIFPFLYCFVYIIPMFVGVPASGPGPTSRLERFITLIYPEKKSLRNDYQTHRFVNHLPDVGEIFPLQILEEKDIFLLLFLMFHFSHIKAPLQRPGLIQPDDWHFSKLYSIVNEGAHPFLPQLFKCVTSLI